MADIILSPAVTATASCAVLSIDAPSTSKARALTHVLPMRAEQVRRVILAQVVQKPVKILVQEAGTCAIITLYADAARTIARDAHGTRLASWRTAELAAALAAALPRAQQSPASLAALRATRPYAGRARATMILPEGQGLRWLGTRRGWVLTGVGGATASLGTKDHQGLVLTAEQEAGA